MDSIVYQVDFYSPDSSKSLRLTDEKPITIPEKNDFITLESDNGTFSGEVTHKGHWVGYSDEFQSTMVYTSVQLSEITNGRTIPIKP